MKYVLFVCSDNAGRSQMAQAFELVQNKFEGKRPTGEIRACADAILTRFDDAPVRPHVHALVERQTRDCLRADSCDALIAA
jgi:protein-tyrosine-phosphatase